MPCRQMFLGTFLTVVDFLVIKTLPIDEFILAAKSLDQGLLLIL